ncbi:UvrD-helicase domain-containing protein [Botrimarina hoheduenensis]|uniref:DNA 3'-5' helicase II n=1 Tax=Botrimarina hoheduenensis TaxID=2528000 RepID=A0A5C5W6S6_9BACT|nr:UvrD-helicase domain-containing protein [Botrimarina hoheduenensis]TWT46390.1 DNA-dependent helicase II [Botrimarina hoheduenensis]
MANKHQPTEADREIEKCLLARRSFSVVAGAGSGKTTSLVEALKTLMRTEGDQLLQAGQQAVCITYTNRAAEVIRSRLRDDPRVLVSTLHSFLWGVLSGHDRSIREVVSKHLLPADIDKQKNKDKGNETKTSITAREKAAALQQVLDHLGSVDTFRYGDDTPYSDFLAGEIGHDDLLRIAAELIESSKAFRAVLGQRHPYFFVDEAQDTSPEVVAALNVLCAGDGLPVVGYFGDPMQQIYDKGQSEFTGPEGAARITKVENFRSGPEVIKLLNRFRNDLEQVPGPQNSELPSSVQVTLVQAETPKEGKRYSEAQLERAIDSYHQALSDWGWSDNATAKQLFLARRMIARRLGFLTLHDLFNGDYASQRAKNDYESGTHYLLKPLVGVAVPIAVAYRGRDTRSLSRCLAENTHRFSSYGTLACATLAQVKNEANRIAALLSSKLQAETLRDVLKCCIEEELIRPSERLSDQLTRKPREETYDDEQHRVEKGDWLADELLGMGGVEVERYCAFLDENTPFSTQHGVKGEEYDDVVVVFDDTEASWSFYSFTKMLTPGVSGEARETQHERSRRLAYVCFSRAIRNLRVLMFTTDPTKARDELVTVGPFEPKQVFIAS